MAAPPCFASSKTSRRTGGTKPGARAETETVSTDVSCQRQGIADGQPSRWRTCSASCTRRRRRRTPRPPLLLSTRRCRRCRAQDSRVTW